MDNPCYSCKTTIPEGVPFCPSCGAPQIRVTFPEPESPPPVIPDQPSAPTFQRQLAPDGTWAPQPADNALLPGAIRWDLAWKGALLAGVGASLLTAVLASVPGVSLLCCVWLLAAGAISVSFYQRQVPGTVITPGMGMKLGALSGAFGFIVHAIWTTVSFIALKSSNEFRRIFQEQMEKTLSSNPDPKAKELLDQFVTWMSSPIGLATLIVLSLLLVAVFFLIFTAAGGALGASVFGRRRESR